MGANALWADDVVQGSDGAIKFPPSVKTEGNSHRDSSSPRGRKQKAAMLEEPTLKKVGFRL